MGRNIVPRKVDLGGSKLICLVFLCGSIYQHFYFLADRILTVARLVQCCVRCRLYVVCTIDSLYRKSYTSIGTKINDLDLCLEVVLRSCQPLRYILR